MILNNKDLFFNSTQFNIIKTSYNYDNYNFCKCGHIEKTNSKVCSACGNDNLISLGYENCFLKTYIYDEIIEIKKFKVYINRSSDDLNLTITPEQTIIKIENNKIIESNESYDSYNRKGYDILRCNEYNYIDLSGLDDIRKNYKYFDKDFDLIDYEENYLNKWNYSKNNVFNYVSFLMIKQICPDYKNYNINIIAYLIHYYIFYEECKGLTYTNFLKQYDIEFLDVVFDNPNFGFSINDLKFWEKLYHNENYYQYEIYLKNDLLYAVNHYGFSASDIRNLVEDFMEFKIEYDDIFKKFLYSNLVIFKRNTIKEYHTRISYLKKNEINLTYDNIKDFKLYIHKTSLTEMKFSNKKLNYVMDLFDKDPLTASNYLSNTKELSSTEIDEIINLLKN